MSESYENGWKAEALFGCNRRQGSALPVR